MNWNRYVTTLKTSWEIEYLKFIRFPMMSWYKDKNGNLHACIDGQEGDLDWQGPAYTSMELLELLPARLPLFIGDYVLEGEVNNNYRQITDSEDDKDLILFGAELMSFKVSDSNDDEHAYLTMYAVNRKGIALNRDSKGVYDNLITWGINEAESRAILILKLVLSHRYSFDVGTEGKVVR